MGYIQIMDADTNEIIWGNQFDQSSYTTVAWSPDEKSIAVGGFGTDIQIIDTATAQQVAQLSGHEDVVISLDWSHDGTRLVSGSVRDQKVYLWDMMRHQEIHHIEVGDVWAVEFSPNDEEIAVGGVGGLSIFPSHLYVGERNEQMLYRTHTHLVVVSIAWNENGNQIAIGTQGFDRPQAEVYIVDATTGATIFQFATGEYAIHGLDWNGDESLIATYGISGFVRVWDRWSGRLTGEFAVAPGYVEQLDFSPYGGRLAYGTAFSPDALTRSESEWSALDPIARLAAHGVAVVVPAPSLERLNTIARLCGALPRDAAPITADGLDGWLAALDDPTRGAPVPPACSADLRAVGAALNGR
jgi:WD40 repeat protein